MLCMAFAAVSFNYVYLYLAEVYPTTMRNRVTAGCIAVAEVSNVHYILINGMRACLDYITSIVAQYASTFIKHKI